MGDLDLPYLHLKNEDVFEGVEVFDRKYGGLARNVGLTLLKIRLLMDLWHLQMLNTGKAAEGLPAEISNILRGHVVSAAVTARKEVMEKPDQARNIETLKGQIAALVKSVNKINEHFWAMLLDRNRDLSAKPGMFTLGGREEAQLTLLYSYASWAETPGALGILEAVFLRALR